MFKRFAYAAALACALLYSPPFAHAQAQALAPEPFAFRNVLVCGDATSCPNQRGVTTVGGNIANTSTMTSDFWDCVGGASSSINWSVVTPGATIPGSSLAYQMQRTAANANTAQINCGQVLDTDRSVLLQGKLVVLSLKSLATALGGTNGFSALNSNVTLTITAGTGTAQGYASMVAGTWTGTSVVATGVFTESTLSNAGFIFGNVPNNATELGINISWLPVGTAGTGDLIQFTQVQLEPITLVPGSPVGPTAFEAHPADLEFAMAQRRAFVLVEANTVNAVVCAVTGANTTACPIPLTVPMRAAPTATITTIGGYQLIIDGAAGAGATGGTGITGTPNACTVQFTNTITAAVHSVQLRGSLTTGRLTCSADLTMNVPANENAIALAS